MGTFSRDNLKQPATLLSIGFGFTLGFTLASVARDSMSPAWLASLAWQVPAGPIVLGLLCAAAGAWFGQALHGLDRALNPLGRLRIVRRGGLLAGLSALAAVAVSQGSLFGASASRLIWLGYGLLVVAFLVAVLKQLPFGALRAEFDGAGPVPGFFRGALAGLDAARREELEALLRDRPAERCHASGLLGRTVWAVASFGVARVRGQAVTVYPWSALGDAVSREEGVARSTVLDGDGYHYGLTDRDIAAREARGQRGHVVQTAGATSTTRRFVYSRVPGGVDVIPRTRRMSVELLAALEEGLRAGGVAPWGDRA